MARLSKEMMVKYGLTRQGEILPLLVEGKSNSEIALVLGISPNTVRTHLYHIYKRLGVKNRTQAVIKFLG